MTEPNWGPSGKLVYERTYSRTKPDGTKETWPETVRRVVDGNLGLVSEKNTIPYERDRLIELMTDFKILPAGRHLWASGVPGRQYLFNCHVSGWGEIPSEHFSFTFLRLMEGGGVGANYSNRFLSGYEPVYGPHEVHIVCDPEHPDFEKMRELGVLSTRYDHEWAGAFEVEDSREGWAGALVDLVDTYYRPAQNEYRVFDVSRVRAEGARLKTFGGRASGPAPLAVMLREVADVLNRVSLTRNGMLDGLSAMEIDHAIATCVVSGGNRRSARMAIMHWADPQILDFIRAKQTTGKHWTTNISVELDTEFWEGIGYQRSAEHAVLDAITKGMHENGEPGFWDSDLSNVGEPNQLISTNPCGEIALEAWENCNLGHVNLAGFVDDEGVVDEMGLHEAHRLMTRFLIRATEGDVNDERQAAVLARNRRIGVGHFGVASFLGMTATPYSQAPAGDYFRDLLRRLAAQVDRAATDYAHQLRIPVPVKKRTVAPTGTIAKMPGVSEGIHPIFAKHFLRRIRLSTIDPDQVRTIDEYASQGFKVEPCLYAPNTMVIEIPTKDSLLAAVEEIHGKETADRVVESADDLSLPDMLRFQKMYQSIWADNAVSYTANFDPARYSPDDIAFALSEIGEGLKGATVFPETSMPQSPYERISEADYQLYQLMQITRVADSVDEECATGACPVR